MTALRWGAATSEGLVRDANEDAYVALPLVFAVADGMGGHQAGEVASALAVQTLRDRLGEGAATVEPVIAAVVEANATIFSAARRNAGQQGMGTTLTALAVLGPTADDPTRTLALVNVGDSRTYRVRGGKLERVTIDHSYVQELVSTGHITEVEARTHPRRNIVTRALGIEPTVRVDSWVLSMVRGDRFVLCSDGLVDEVPDSEIEVVAAGLEDPQAAADELVAMANRHGGRDNVTVLVVDVVEGIELADEPLLMAVADADADAGAIRDDDTATIPVTAPPADPPSGEGEGPGAAAATGASAATESVLTVPELPPRDGLRADTGPVLTSPAEVAAAGAAPPERKRRFTLGLFLFLLGLAAIVTLTITLIAVAVSDDDQEPTDTTVPSPVETIPDTSPDTTPTSDGPTLPPTTLPTTTLPPTTVASTSTLAPLAPAPASTASP